MKHKTVLLREAVDSLQLSPHSIVVDATYGSGGHAQSIVSKLDASGVYVGIDADSKAFESKILGDPKAAVHLVNDNFRNIKSIICSLHIEKINAIVADLGWRMEQFNDGGKGFSFNAEEPLLMTYGDPDTYPFTAYDIINEWSEETLANIMYGYAEERFARRIARSIVTIRKQKPIRTATELRDVVVSALPKAVRFKSVHPATKAFQAFRIAVNDELGALETFLKDSFEVLAVDGVLAIITFHSIEDRIVKNCFRNLVVSKLAIYTPKKPIYPSDDELIQNPRARSAKLRVIKKC